MKAIQEDITKLAVDAVGEGDGGTEATASGLKALSREPGVGLRPSPGYMRERRCRSAAQLKPGAVGAWGSVDHGWSDESGPSQPQIYGMHADEEDRRGSEKGW